MAECSAAMTKAKEAQPDRLRQLAIELIPAMAQMSVPLAAKVLTAAPIPTAACPINDDCKFRG
jgi:hypothetical protein